MQLSPRTLTVLKNFTNINPGLVFHPGKTVKTVSASEKNVPIMDVLAVAKIEDEIEKEFAISNLSQFINILSSFENPKLKLKDKTLSVTEDKREVQYTYGNPAFIVQPPDKEIKMPQTLAEFKLTAADLDKLTRLTNVLNVPEIAIVVEECRLFVRGLDVKNPTNNVYNHKLVDSIQANNFIVVFSADKFNNLLAADYDVTVAKGVVKFASKDVTYWLAPQEKYSTYAK